MKFKMEGLKSEIGNQKSEVGGWIQLPVSSLQLLVIYIVTGILFSACKQKSNERITDSGMKYIVYKENPGPKAKRGDFVTIDLIYKTEYDSVLFDSRQNNAPMRFQLEEPPFQGSMEDGITYMAAGDSVTFLISADSMVQKVFSKISGGNYVRPDFLKSGSKLKFDVKLLRIQNELDAAAEMYHELDRLAALEKSDIERYVSEHHITQHPDTNGVYVIKSIEGKGAAVDSGKTVSINYTGKFLDGTVFDSNSETGKPVVFIFRKDDMIKGWDIAFSKLRKGDHATVIIPSAKAWGEKGIRNKANGTYFIQPNTPLLYEVEVLDVK
jgi:FKBP-type peptidyl-prolyl cis-trans isomerase FkpA